MEIQVLKYALTVCKARSLEDIDFKDEIFFIGKTDEELSLVCTTAAAPSDTVEREDGWRGFRICGTLEFSLVGILSKLSAILADKGIGIFAVSTYNTDYILVKSENLERAVAALAEAGYKVGE